MRKPLLPIVAVFAMLWAALGLFVYTSPVVVLHYAASATSPVVYFYNENDRTTKESLAPGGSVAFRTPHRPPADYFIEVSLPFGSREGVEIRQPFSRVDVFIGADTKIARTVIRRDFLARVAGN